MWESEVPLETLWERYLQSRSIKDRNSLADRLQGLVHKTLGRIPIPRWVDKCDLSSYLKLVLVQSIEKYDPNRSKCPAAYLIFELRNHAKDYFRTANGMKRRVWELYAMYQNALETLRLTMHRQPSHDEVCESIGQDPTKMTSILSWQQNVAHNTERPIYRLVPGTEDSPEDACEDPKLVLPGPTDAMFITRVVKEYCAGPSSKHLVARRMLFLQHTAPEIAYDLQISFSRVHQLWKEAQTDLRIVLTAHGYGVESPTISVGARGFPVVEQGGVYERQ